MNSEIGRASRSGLPLIPLGETVSIHALSDLNNSVRNLILTLACLKRARNMSDSARGGSQTVIATMKTYGLTLGDNGSTWYFQGTADARWTNNEVDRLKAIPASRFVAVNESCLMVSPNSGQALQLGTSEFVTRCGEMAGDRFW